MNGKTANPPMQNRVAVHFTGLKSYPDSSPYHPAEKYPEFKGDRLDSSNRVYGAVRETLHLLGLDRENFGTPQWNPFREQIEPGMTVFLKPNTVQHVHEGNKDIFSVILHASILRPILDYICIALQGRGRIIIGDSQIIFGRFDTAMNISGIASLLDWYGKNSAIPIECFDLRIVRGTRSWMYGRWARTKVEADPRGYVAVDLGDRSYFRDIDPKRLRIAIASHKEMYRYHSGGRHQYIFPNSFLQSDAVVNVAKLKTHRRTAITLALKNYMGIPALKDCLPHFITGSPQEGGDQYINPSVRKRICLSLHDQIQSNPFIPVKFACAVVKKAVWETQRVVPFKDDVYEAMWPGNDTLWRTLLDLNRIVMYADKQGVIRDVPQRSQVALIDGIVGGEKDGPVAPDPVRSGVLLAGTNPAAVDAVGATLMGFDIDKIPLVRKAFEISERDLPIFRGSVADIRINDDGNDIDLATFRTLRNLGFEPHPGWKGHADLPIPGPATRV